MIRTSLNQIYRKVANSLRHTTDRAEDRYEPIDKNIFKEYNAFRQEGALPLFCYVPFNSLTFSFQGKVYACTYNREILLGCYPLNSLEEIWSGEEAEKLRGHMRHNDLEYGCQHCKYFFDKKKFSNLKPFVFDKYADIDRMSYPRVMEFELSNECNLECQMCSGEVSSSIRKNRDKLPAINMPYDEKFIGQLEPFIPHLKEAKFFGGEPFLISIYFDIWERMLEINPGIQFFVITNGTHWNNKIKSLLERGHFDIAISIDALDKEKLQQIRRNANYEKLIENIHRFNEYALRNGRRISLSFTLQKDNWQEFPRMIAFCNELKAIIYVSYLEWPIRYAISDLTASELKYIKDTLEGYEFPNGTSYEQHNYKCFKDFLGFIGKVSHESTDKSYVEYRFGEIGQKEEAHTEGSIRANTLDEYRIRFEAMVNEYFAKSDDLAKNKATKKEKIIYNLSSVMSQFKEEEQFLIYERLFTSPLRMTMISLLRTPVEQLVFDCRGLLTT